MSTILFNNIIFGPIKSRRLGTSLGVNLLPAFGKFCSFDCIYCECGWNKDGTNDRKLPTIEEVTEALRSTLNDFKDRGESIDTITFSGNGEPTLHPKFNEIIAETIVLRDKIFPLAKVSVLTNGSKISDSKVKEALLSIDNAIIKIDSAFEETVRLIDRPQYNYSTENMVEYLSDFKGKFVLQTMFLRGETGGTIVDNTTQVEVERWIDLVKKIVPREIMIYTIDRETPEKSLKKVSVEEMERIAMPLIEAGYQVKISG